MADVSTLTSKYRVRLKIPYSLAKGCRYFTFNLYLPLNVSVISVVGVGKFIVWWVGCDTFRFHYLDSASSLQSLWCITFLSDSARHRTGYTGTCSTGNSSWICCDTLLTTLWICCLPPVTTACHPASLTILAAGKGILVSEYWVIVPASQCLENMKVLSLSLSRVSRRDKALTLHHLW